MFVYLLAAACGPGTGTSSTDTASATTTASTSASTGDSATTTATTSDSPTTQPTSTTGPALGCTGTDEATCSASSALSDENRCVWVDVFTAAISGTVCRTELARSTCMEASANEGGPGCSGFFIKVEQGGVELLVGTGCGDPASEPAWEFCFIDGVTPAIPECACIGESYCADQIGEVNCAMASHDLRACSWDPPICVPA